MPKLKAKPTMEKTFFIDVDVVIEKYNAKNPEKKPMTRKSLAEELGCNTQLFSDWKSQKNKTNKPAVLNRIFRLMEIGNCKLEDFVTHD